jgi:hypothetical protein
MLKVLTEDKGVIDYLIFAPFAIVEEHALLEHLMAESLVNSGQKVVVIRCGGVLNSWCVSFTYLSMKESSSQLHKSGVCTRCRSNCSQFGKVGSYETIELDEFVMKDDQSQWETIRSRLTTENWLEFEFDGIPFGRFWAYDTILERKSIDFKSDASAFNRYIKEAQSSFYAYCAAKRIQKKYSVRNVGCHSFQYAINRSFIEPFQKSPTKTYSFAQSGMTCLNDYFLDVRDTNYSYYSSQDSKYIAQLRFPLKREEKSIVSLFFDEQINARHAWVYSRSRGDKTATEIRKTLQIEKETKVVLILTSSPDEPLAADVARLNNPKDPVCSDTDFLKICIEVARRNLRIQFVLRLHPRLTTNKRDNVVSPWLLEIKHLLADLPPNMIINENQDGLGLYDVAMITDVAINYRTTAGLELILLGIPTISSDSSHLKSYPIDLSPFRAEFTVESIENRLEEAIKAEPSIDQIRLALRWIAISMLRSQNSIGDFLPVVDGLLAKNRIESSSDQTRDRLPITRHIPESLKSVIKAIKIIFNNPLSQRLESYMESREINIKTLEKKIASLNRLDDSTEVILNSAMSENARSRDEELIVSETLTRIRNLLSPWDGSEGSVNVLQRRNEFEEQPER